MWTWLQSISSVCQRAQTPWPCRPVSGHQQLQKDQLRPSAADPPQHGVLRTGNTNQYRWEFDCRTCLGIGLYWAVFYVPSNTVQVIWETVFTGQKTQPTVSKYWTCLGRLAAELDFVPAGFTVAAYVRGYAWPVYTPEHWPLDRCAARRRGCQGPAPCQTEPQTWKLLSDCWRYC